MFITGPEVIRVVTGEHVNFEELGGGDVHNVTSGVAHFLPKTEEECAAGVRRLLSYFLSATGGRPRSRRPATAPDGPAPGRHPTVREPPTNLNACRKVVPG